MKNTVRILSLLFALMLSAVTFVHAEPFDLSNLSYEELIELHKQVSLAIMQSDEWKEVTVPAGTYIIGQDIPAGDYTVTYTGIAQSVLYVYPSAQALEEGTQVFSKILSDAWGISVGKLSLTDGQVIVIQSAPVVFTPYKGLGF